MMHSILCSLEELQNMDVTRKLKYSHDYVFTALRPQSYVCSEELWEASCSDFKTSTLN